MITAGIDVGAKTVQIVIVNEGAVIDTSRCDGCGACASVCPAGVLAVLAEAPHEPWREIPVTAVREAAPRCPAWPPADPETLGTPGSGRVPGP